MEEIISNEYKKSYEGLVDLSEKVRPFALGLPLKLAAMEEKYLENHPIYSDTQIRKIKYLREAYAYKFYLSVLHLEQLWALHHIGKHLPLRDVLCNVFDLNQIEDDILLLSSFAMEGFIIQGAAFLDFYFLYVCSVFNTQIIKKSSQEETFGDQIQIALTSIDGPLKEQAKKVAEYYKDNVFNTDGNNKYTNNNWGGILKKLRNQLVHRDNNHPNYMERKPLVDKIIGNYHNNASEIYLSRFCQDLQNGMLDKIITLSQFIYGLEMKVGPYKPGMWD